MGVKLADGPNIGVRQAASALDGVGVGAPIVPAGEQQDELFDLDGPEGAQGPVSGVLERRGPGRPKGAINKRTEDLRRFLLARYKHPVVALAEIYSVPTEELATALGMKVGDVFALQIRAAAEVAPYVDSKMPAKIAISDSDRLPSFSLVFGDGRVVAQDQAGNRLDLTALAAKAKAAHLQRLTGGEAAGSHDTGSHDDGKTIEHQLLSSE